MKTSGDAARAADAESDDAGGRGPAAPCAHVVWHSSLLDLSGYAQVARTLVVALEEAGVKIRVEPIWGSMRRVDP